MSWHFSLFGRAPGISTKKKAKRRKPLVVECLEDPAYAGRTMGVISLVGSEQARLITKLLTRRVDPAEMDRRRLLCGGVDRFRIAVDLENQRPARISDAAKLEPSHLQEVKNPTIQRVRASIDHHVD